MPLRQQQGWRYVLLVERLQGTSAAPSPGVQRQRSKQSSDTGKDPEQEDLPALRHTSADADTAPDDVDLAIDLSWLAGTARSRPPKQTPVAILPGSPAPARPGALPPQQLQQEPQQQQQQAAADRVDSLEGAADNYEAEPWLATQVPPTPGGCRSPGMLLRRAGSTQQQQQTSSQGGHLTAGGGSGGASGGGSLQFAEHRSVRCSLVDSVWPLLTAAFRWDHWGVDTLLLHHTVPVNVESYFG